MSFISVIIAICLALAGPLGEFAGCLTSHATPIAGHDMTHGATADENIEIAAQHENDAHKGGCGMANCKGGSACAVCHPVAAAFPPEEFGDESFVSSWHVVSQLRLTADPLRSDPPPPRT